ncbi:VanZ family protein [Paraflavitalea sp. CAU 1676]|uniref:VanZ family protein n=1 Tax=Paraflavitalea sp. CAU 1676 TaxID=3032598 RepID=UPI0023DB101A|nr:VanZ family protein [Paraflavitalea sp. CAU 1676]MDF2187129.1 VanZ family protein [Paraflavitalea sp. CAU 1676]
MRLLLRKLCTKKILPILWTIITIVLLCLPGSAIPGDGIQFFEIPHFDKVVHVILFGGIVFFWGAHCASNGGTKNTWIRELTLITVLTIALGIVLEYVQFYFIPQRSFDRGDIVADASGAIVASLWLLYLYPIKAVSR